MSHESWLSSVWPISPPSSCSHPHNLYIILLLPAHPQLTDVSLDSLKGKYTVLFFYPLDFTFVCPTEIVAFSDRVKDFKDINCQVCRIGKGAQQ